MCIASRLCMVPFGRFAELTHSAMKPVECRVPQELRFAVFASVPVLITTILIVLYL
uniref:Uncharacterized protein n=1 Tax=Arundo donax TaxID=35708 RepID=A0A0A9EGR9_ARUDO